MEITANRSHDLIALLSIIGLTATGNVAISEAAEIAKVFEVEYWPAEIGLPVISDGGSIAFHGRDGLEGWINRFDYGLVSEAYRENPDVPHIFTGSDRLDINSNGSIIFAGQSLDDLTNSDNCGTLYILESSLPVPIDQKCGNVAWLQVSISDAGQVLYVKTLADRYSIVSNVDGVEHFLFDEAGEFWLFPVQNDHGTVAAREFFSDRLVLRPASGGQVVVADATMNFCNLVPTSINDQGELIFTASDCLTRLNGIYRYSNGNITAIVTDAEPGTQINIVDKGYINDLGNIIFVAGMTDGRNGLFEYGPDGIQAIVLTGDIVADHELVSIQVSNHPLNNSGNVTFYGERYNAETVTSHVGIYIAATKLDSNANGRLSNGGGAMSLGFVVLCLCAVMMSRPRAHDYVNVYPVDGPPLPGAQFAATPEQPRASARSVLRQ